MVFIWRSNLEFIKKWLDLCLIGEQRPRNHIGDTNTIVFTCDETLLKRDRQAEKYYELCDVAFQNRVKKKGDWQCQMLAVGLAPEPAPANCSSVALWGELIVLPSDYVGVPAIFLATLSSS